MEDLLQEDQQQLITLQSDLASLQSSLSNLPSRIRLTQLMEQSTAARAAADQAKQALAIAMQNTMTASTASTDHLLQTHARQQVEAAAAACLTALQSAGFPLPASVLSPSEQHAWLEEQSSIIQQHRSSLQGDVRRVERELTETIRTLGSMEGQLKQLQEMKQDYEEMMNTLREEITAEYHLMGITPSLDDAGLSEVMSGMIYHTGNMVVQGALTTTLLTTVNKHYLILQFQEKVDSLLPKETMICNQIKVGLVMVNDDQ